MSLRYSDLMHRFCSILLLTVFCVVVLSFTSSPVYAMHIQKRSEYLDVRQDGLPLPSLDFSASSESPSASSFPSSSITTSNNSLSSTSASVPSESPLPQSQSLSVSTRTSSSVPTSSSSSSISPTLFATASSQDSSSTLTSDSSSLSSTTSSSEVSEPSPTTTSTSISSTSTSILVTGEPFSSFDPTPATTIVVAAGDISSDLPSPSVSPSLSSMSRVPTTIGGSSRDSEFFSNTPAVAGTMTAVVVVGLVVVAALCMFIRRRRHSQQFRGLQFAEKSFEPSLQDSRPPSKPSSHELMDAPMDAYTTREPAYYPRDPFSSSPSNDSYTAGSLSELTYSYARDAKNQYPYYPDGDHNPQSEIRPKLLNQTPTNSCPSSRTNLNPFADPVPQTTPFASSKTNFSLQPPLSPLYEPSIDSFYGAASM